MPGGRGGCPGSGRSAGPGRCPGGPGESRRPPRAPRPLRAYPGPGRAPPVSAASTESRPQPPRTAQRRMPSQLEHAMETLMFTFHKYAGDKEHLAKEDLRELMDKEFPGFLENQRDPQALERILRDVEQSRDGRVGFQGFFSLVAGLTMACNDYFVLHMKQRARK
ncbi:protein S100-A10 isoform 1-T1 [Cyanocitta cristata]